MPFCRNKFKSTIIFLFLLFAVACRETEKPVAPDASAAAPTPSTPPTTLGEGDGDDRPIILAFGDSLTAGYGLSPTESYPTLLQARLDERGYRYRVVNAGVSGDTTAGGRRRLDWSLEGPVKLMILALGGNDGLRGQPVAELKANLAAMIELAQGRGVRVVLAGMEAPPNLGPEYTRGFRSVYGDLARQYRIPLIPFLLEGVGGRPELNQPDGIHPNVEGEKLLLENVWRVVEPELGGPELGGPELGGMAREGAGDGQLR